MRYETISLRSRQVRNSTNYFLLFLLYFSLLKYNKSERSEPQNATRSKVLN